MSTEIDQEESAPNIARELLDLGLIHEVKSHSGIDRKLFSCLLSE